MTDLEQRRQAEDSQCKGPEAEPRIAFLQEQQGIQRNQSD